ncbi:choline transporter-like 2 [Culex quinquefasciatus]|uniref:choline transporter-like 2 n=1 Tax=Culex quinquefasciatus TaxID=7176 RepID=UPI0018E3E7E8|nr:choline transporter-like 2 [Culex quinquefasciatus]
MDTYNGPSRSIVQHNLNDVRHHTEAAPFQHNNSFKGPVSRRSATDPSWLYTLIGFLVCWILVFVYALIADNLDEFVVHTDSQGLRCGVDAGVEDKPYVFFFDFKKCDKDDITLHSCRSTRICVDQCPKENFDFVYYKCLAGKTYYRNGLICNQTVNKDKLEDCGNMKWYIENDLCAEEYFKSALFSKICWPTSKKDMPENFAEVIQVLSETDNLFFDDVRQSWLLVLGVLVLSLLATVLFILMLRWIAKPMIWITIASIFAVLIFVIYYSYNQYDTIKNRVIIHPEVDRLLDSLFKMNNINIRTHMDGSASEYYWLTAMIILLIVLVVLLLLIWAMRKRVLLAIALVKEGSKAVRAIFSTVFFPIFPWIVQILVITFAITVGLQLASIGAPVFRVKGLNATQSCKCDNGYSDGDICSPATFRESCKRTGDRICTGEAACHFEQIETPLIVWFFHAFNVVGLFWGVSFASAFGEMVLAFTFATWYWTTPKKNLQYFVLKEGFLQTVRYHLGTLAFGSFIIAMTKIIRKVLEFMDRQLRKYDFGVIRAIVCACRFCFEVLEKFLKFLNRNAYIMCALHGKDFWSSSKDAFNLLSRNVLRVITVNGVTGFLFFLSKLVLASSMAALTYTCFHTETTKQLNYPATPAILVFFGTYVIANVFFSVYSVAIDTLCLCFLEDCERNDGSKERPYHMSNSLMKILNNTQGVNNIR